MALFLIQQRRKRQDAERDEAIKDRRWSNVAGLDGISIGLILAESIILDEMKHMPVKKVK